MHKMELVRSGSHLGAKEGEEFKFSFIMWRQANSCICLECLIDDKTISMEYNLGYDLALNKAESFMGTQIRQHDRRMAERREAIDRRKQS